MVASGGASSSLLTRVDLSRMLVAASMEMAKQTRQAVAEADVVVFVVDARAGLSGQDHEIAAFLRKLGKPCILVANKAEG